MRTTSFSDWRGLPTKTPGLWTPDPVTETTLDRDNPGQRQPWPETTLEGIWDHRNRPPEETWDQAARQEMTPYRGPLVDRMTDTRFRKHYLAQNFVCGG